MKKLAILTLALCLTACGTVGTHSTTTLFNPDGGIPILHAADLRAIDAIAKPAIANGAGYKIKAADNCALAFLNHPEYLTPDAPPAEAPAAPVATAGPLSEGFVLAVKLDAEVRSAQRLAALFTAPLPDDIMIACAALHPNLGGIAHALQSFLHPAASGAGAR